MTQPMTTAPRFNCVDEPWIPVQNHGLASMRQVFEDEGLKSLGGSPIQKLAVFKLLQAVAQSACTPETEEDWNRLDLKEFQRKCLDYLDRWHDAFWLTGAKPFLQMPQVAGAAVQPFAALDLEKASGNTSLLTQWQMANPLDDAQKALLLVTLMAFATAGKKVDNQVVLSADYDGKPKSEKGGKSSGRCGPALGFRGYLHSMVLGESILSTLHLALATLDGIARMKCFPEGLGTAPWEKMPQTENCPVARSLQRSFMGRLVPMNRFCLLSPSGVHFTEGILYDGYADGVFEPTQTISRSGKKYVTLWTDPSKMPWRSLTAILSFLDATGANAWSCPQLQWGLERCKRLSINAMIWSGGQSLTSKAGEQYVGSADDSVESIFEIGCNEMSQEWFAKFCTEMQGVEKLSKILFSAVQKYCDDPNRDKKIAGRAVAMYWEGGEPLAQELIDSCIPGQSSLPVRRKFAALMRHAYDAFCPRGTPRQMQEWVKNRPNVGDYLKE